MADQDPAFHPAYFDQPYPQQPYSHNWPHNDGSGGSAGKTAIIVAGSVFLGVLFAVLLYLFITIFEDKGNLSQEIIEWRDGASEEWLQVATDLELVSNSADARDILGTREACGVLAADVQDAMGTLPTPDAELTKHLQNSLTDLYKGALQCKTMSTASDAESVAAYIESGNNSLVKATAIMAQAEAGNRE